MSTSLKEIGVLTLTTIAALTNFIVFGLVHYRTWSDAQEYSAYAALLVQSGLYSFDGVHFDIGREPGYPFFLAFVYRMFGVENLLAVGFIQALLLGFLGYVVYRIFFESGYQKTGVAAGVIVSALPSYGYYANEILTELLFAFLLGVVFWVVMRIVHDGYATHWRWYALVGAVCGYATLVRVQFLFFVPFLVLCYAIFGRPYAFGTAKKIIIGCAVFAMVVGSWGVYVQQNLGYFALTEGRQDSVIHIRAVRAELSYRELTQYAAEWILRSVSGGAPYALLDANEAKGISQKYFAMATTSEIIAQIKQRDIATILAHPGQYLYGNVIEVMKMAYLEHDYTDSQSRYFRPVVYALMYAFCLFGLFQIARNWRTRQLRAITILAILFPLYNFGILSFFDTVPRFNTPYLLFYIIIGCIGIALLSEKKSRI
jgi:4-amino-4-deoxy-L-arabinose transferase-like glycosyltransferase